MTSSRLQRPRLRALLAALMLSSLTLIGLPPAQAEMQTLDRIVAVVNSSVITQRQLDAQVARVAHKVSAGDLSPSDRHRLEKQVLDRMITQKVELERAKQLGISIDDTRLNQALSGIAARNGMNLLQLRNAVTSQGQDWSDYRDHIRKQMLTEELLRREVYDRINITDREINDYLKQYTGGSAEKKEYHLEQILISVPEDATPDQVKKAKERADDALAALKDGKPFKQVSTERSDAPNAESGGDLGWRDVTRIPTLFTGPMKQLKDGQISGLIRSPNGFHIIKLLGTRTVTAGARIKEYQVEHVLIQVNADRDPQAARDEAVKLRQEIRDGKASFADVARQYSDDRGSASQGGQLGWVKPGDVVPAFATAMEKTPVGQISPVFQSQYGFHFLKVEATRKVKLSADQLRAKARQAIGERRADEEQVKWLRRMRAEAYIENRLTGTTNSNAAGSH